MTATTTAPADFDTYWSTAMDELDALPPAPELTVMPLRSTDFGTVYDLRLTSIGPYRFFAYYCVPNGDGPFPALVHTPNYGSVVHIPPYEERQRYAVLSLCHRGQRLSDQPFAAAYPGLLTEGIDTPSDYIYRGIVADCCRAIDFLQSRSEVDQTRIAVSGNDLALFTAALRPAISSLYYTPGPFHAAAERVPATSAYPLEEINDYLRAHPERADAVWNTLSYFEPRYMAPRVGAETLLVTGANANALASLINAFPSPPEQHVATTSGYKDGAHEAGWIAERSGFAEPILPAQWQ